MAPSHAGLFSGLDQSSKAIFDSFKPNSKLKYLQQIIKQNLQSDTIASTIGCALAL